MEIESEILAVCVGLPREVEIAGKKVMTGIYKEPVDGRVMLRTLNLDGDRQADPEFHGGELKAAYAYSWDDYRFWSRELDRELMPGTFGENFTVTGLQDPDVHIGDIFQIGPAAKVQVTHPRLPCFKLGHKMGDPSFPDRFRKAARLGFYLKVLEEGEVGAGHKIKLLERGDSEISMRRLWELVYDDKPDPELAARAAEHPLTGKSWRKKLLDRTV
jgi:MOSC domain-containing protein YiiM